MKKAKSKLNLGAALSKISEDAHVDAWEKKTDPTSGQNYWVNSVTQKSSWNDPTKEKKTHTRESMRQMRRQSSATDGDFGDDEDDAD